MSGLPSDCIFCQCFLTEEDGLLWCDDCQEAGIYLNMPPDEIQGFVDRLLAGEPSAEVARAVRMLDLLALFKERNASAFESDGRYLGARGDGPREDS